MLPLMQLLWATELSYLTQYATTLGNRLWKRKGTVWATAYGNGKEQFGQPFMETEGNC
jgi:hypothetical protein